MHRDDSARMIAILSACLPDAGMHPLRFEETNTVGRFLRCLTYGSGIRLLSRRGPLIEHTFLQFPSSISIRGENRSDILLPDPQQSSSTIRQIYIVDSLFVTSYIALDDGSRIVIALGPVRINHLHSINK
jgi:hypothetical protein